MSNITTTVMATEELVSIVATLIPILIALVVISSVIRSIMNSGLIGHSEKTKEDKPHEFDKYKRRSLPSRI